MPWKECSVLDERLKFVARRLEGEAMADVCREFGISRKTGYKIFERYQECGIHWLVSFMQFDLGYFDLETRVLEPLENPLGQKRYPCSRFIL